MALRVNWVEQDEKASKHIEVSLFAEKFIIYYVDNVITRTEWCLKQGDELLDENEKWLNIQQYICNPTEALTVNLKQQGSDFRNKVWAEMCKIPLGQTLSYSKMAKKLNSGARAVANACRDNPFPGIIPCHRVVAVANLGGYMGQTSGRCLDIKRKLLMSELGRAVHEK